MAKLIVLLLSLCLANFNLKAQVFVLKDCSNHESVAYAHIVNLNSNEYAVSNESGEFTLKHFNQSDKLQISHISYVTVNITVEELLTEKIICLEQNVSYLTEVIVKASTNYDFLMTAVSNTQSKLMLPGKVNAYYKEFIKRDNEYTHFCDADLTYFLYQKKGKINIDGALHESRAYELPSSDSGDNLDLDIVSPIGYKKTMELYFPKNIGRFLKDEADSKYNYDIFELEDQFLVNVDPIENQDGVYAAKILIDKMDTTIHSVNFWIPEERKEHTKEVNAIVAKLKILQNRGYLIYTKTSSGQIYPSFLRIDYDIKISNKKRIDQISSFITDINVYEIPNDQTEIPKSSQFNKKSIYKQGTNYNTNYWTDKSLMTLTEKEKGIIENASQWKND